MKNIIISCVLISIVLFSGKLLFAQQCGTHSDAEYENLLKEAENQANSGNEAQSDKLMQDAGMLVMEDISLAVSIPIPGPQGQFCMPNPTTEYIDCLMKLGTRAEYLGVGNKYPEVAMNRAIEAIDQWTTQLSNTKPPVGDALCKEFLNCLMKALAQRELVGLSGAETDRKLQAMIDEILKKGCNPCSVKWMAIAEARISWHSGDEIVTMKGRATWENFYIMLNQLELENKCMTIDYDDRLTFPFACIESVVTGKGENFPKPLLELLDGDKTFAKSMADASIVLCCQKTDNPADLKIISYIGFDNHGEQVIIPISDKVVAINKRRYFTVNQTVTKDEIPTYRAEFTFKFIPVW